MTLDLFKSKKELLYDFMKQRKLIKTHEVVEWGVKNYCNEPTRLARKLKEEGKIKRMDKDTKILYYGNVKEDVWICEN